MTVSPDYETLIDTAISHIARIAYRHRDNPFLTHIALLELAPAHRSLPVKLHAALSFTGRSLR